MNPTTGHHLTGQQHQIWSENELNLYKLTVLKAAAKNVSPAEGVQTAEDVASA